jgi:uncharacterized protein DUF6335
MKATHRRTKSGKRRLRRPREVGTPVDVIDLTWDDDDMVYATGGVRLTGGDIDAEWRGADAVGDEAVGGTVATPDQSVVDDIGDALGLSQRADAELRTSSEILDERDRHRWELDSLSPRRRRG